jgi:hypothetical protein
VQPAAEFEADLANLAAEGESELLVHFDGDGGTPVLSNTVNAPVDLFDTSTNLVSDLNPSNFGDLVTFTATRVANDDGTESGDEVMVFECRTLYFIEQGFTRDT